MRKVGEDEAAIHTSTPCLVCDTIAFSLCTGDTANHAIHQITPGWEAAKQLEHMEPGTILPKNFMHCCELPLQYSLPCHHYLHQLVIEGFPIPLLFINPWWMNGQSFVKTDWTLSYYDATLDPALSRSQDHLANSGRNFVLSSILAMSIVQAQLGQEKSE
jgi:hypothetical protein